MFAKTSLRSISVSLLGIAVMLAACSKKRQSAHQATASAAAPASASAQPPRPPEVMSAYQRQLAAPPIVPVGPKIGLVPGQGAPPIMFGATVATIERLMGAPCYTKTETLCRYPAQALEFHLDRGVLVKIHAHRRLRPAGKDKRGLPMEFGALHGGIPAEPSEGRPDGVALGMTIPGVAIGMPNPERVEKVTEQNVFGTVERHHYPGAILEYDRFKGTTDDVPVLGGIVIVPNGNAKAVIAREQAKLADQK
jgi:hypothetical protein